MGNAAETERIGNFGDRHTAFGKKIFCFDHFSIQNIVGNRATHFFLEDSEKIRVFHSYMLYDILNS